MCHLMHCMYQNGSCCSLGYLLSHGHCSKVPARPSQLTMSPPQWQPAGLSQTGKHDCCEEHTLICRKKAEALRS